MISKGILHLTNKMYHNSSITFGARECQSWLNSCYTVHTSDLREHFALSNVWLWPQNFCQ